MPLGRDTRRYRQLRAELFLTRPCCWWCDLAIKWDAPPRSRWAPSIDHLIPLSLGGAPEDPDNMVVAHYGCNSQRRNNLDYQQHNPVSRPW